MQNFGRENFDNSTCIRQILSDFSTVKVLRYTVGDCFRHNMYMYILYLRFEDAITVNLCMGLPITNTTDGQWLNS